MRAVIQRVSRAGVTVNNNIQEIKEGLVVLLGVTHDDTEQDSRQLAEKILNLRIFPNEEGKFDKSVADIKGEILIVSQFTLYGDCSGGRRPDFTQAARPVQAKELYDKFVDYCRLSGLKVATGEFQSTMTVEIHNNGPVTIILDSKS